MAALGRRLIRPAIPGFQIMSMVMLEVQRTWDEIPDSGHLKRYVGHGPTDLKSPTISDAYPVMFDNPKAILRPTFLKYGDNSPEGGYQRGLVVVRKSEHNDALGTIWLHTIMRLICRLHEAMDKFA